jgi:hypothetical protein
MGEMPQSPEPEAEGREPSVLDWFKSVLRGRPIPIPELPEVEEEAVDLAQTPPPPTLPLPAPGEFDWRDLLSGASPSHVRLPAALGFAFVAQFGLTQRVGSPYIEVVLYAIAGLLVGWGYLAGDFRLQPAEAPQGEHFSVDFRPAWLVAAVAFSLLTVLTSRENTFRPSTVVFWALAMVAVVVAFWEGTIDWRDWLRRAWAWVRHPAVQVSIKPWHWAVLAVAALSLVFRLIHLDQVPFEMWSDHAEKLLDVYDVLNGKYSIFFFRNTGRELIEFYMAAITAKLFGTGLSFLTLKLVTAAAGLLTLPYVYLFAREIAGRRVALLATAMTGIGYWPNLISRLGLRFPFYALFAAPALYYLVKGLRTRRRNDLLLCAAAVGFGLNGYSPARVIPMVVAAGVAIYLLHRVSRGQRSQVLTLLVVMGAVGLVFVLPLFQVSIEFPDRVFFRMLTRMGTAERAYPGSPLVIFIRNVVAALAIFGWDDGQVWVAAVPHRPAFDWLTAAFFHLGVVLMVLRYLRRRDWRDAFTLVSIPLLMLPSTLALAFPGENPALHRASGSYIPAYTLAAMAVVATIDWARRVWGHRRSAMVSVYSGLGLLFVISAVINYRLVLVDYAQINLQSTWNSAQAGEIVKGFAESVGSYDTAHMVPYPYWMDGRLVGINAGQPSRDYSTPSDQLASLQQEPRAQLFLVSTQDEADQALLTELFPAGRWTIAHSDQPGKDIAVFMVPAKVSDLEGYGIGGSSQ